MIKIVLLLYLLPVFANPNKYITAKVGDNVLLFQYTLESPDDTLDCLVKGKIPFFTWRDGQFIIDSKNPSYPVETPTLHNGSLSVVLLNVTKNHTTWYKCEVLKSEKDSVFNIYLNVTGGDEKPNDEGGIQNGTVAVIVILLVTFVVLGIIFRKEIGQRILNRRRETL